MEPSEIQDFLVLKVKLSHENKDEDSGEENSAPKPRSSLAYSLD